MEDKRREILNQVAEGKLSPQEAAAMLDHVGGEETSQPPDPAPAATAVATEGERVRKVRVSSQLGKAVVIGDPTVVTVLAEGAHTVRQDGDLTIVEGEPLAGEGFVFRNRGGMGWAQAIGGGRNTLTVRVNPDAELWVQAAAGSVHVQGIRGPIHAEAQAGSTTIDGFEGPLDLVAQAGSVKARGKLDGGESRIRCEAGSVRLALVRGSSVRIKARSVMGMVRIDGSVSPGEGLSAAGRESREVVIGDGRGLLDIDASMGSVRVEVE